MRTILGRTNLLLTVFFLLIATSAGLTSWGLRTSAEDALVINLAGRQRMLVQQMTRLAAGDLTANRGDLSQGAAAFEETLRVLLDGGSIVYPAGAEASQLPAARDPRTRQVLIEVSSAWEGYRAGLQILQDPAAAPEQIQAAAASIQQRAPGLTAAAEAAVQQLQAVSEGRTATLRWLQAGFFVAAGLLLVSGRLMAGRSIISPLQRLNQSTDRMRLGDLETPVQAGGPQEIRALSERFESLRLELQHSRQELLRLNQELENRVLERTRELEMLQEVGKEISSRLDLPEVLRSITRRTQELMQAETSFLCLLDEGRRCLSLEAISGPEHTVARTSTPLQNPFVHDVLEPACPGCRLACQGTCGIMAEGYRASHLAAPLRLGERTIGALCVGHRAERAFDAEQARILDRMAGLAAVAIENARTYGQAERLAALEERQRIAAEMHDGLAQMVDSLGFLVDGVQDLLERGEAVEAGKQLTGVRDSISLASREVRRTIASLSDEPGRPRSLQEQLAGLLRELAAAHPGARWNAELPGTLFLPADDAAQVLGIAQEALANAARHAAAQEVCLSLLLAGEQAVLAIADDGCGFDPQAASFDGRKHFGLKILQARAAHLGGSLQVQSAPGQGARVSLTWPVRRLILAHPQPSGEEHDSYAHPAGR